MERNGHCRVHVIRLDEVQKFARAGDVGPFSDVDEILVGRRDERIESGEPQVRFDLRRHARRDSFHGFRDCADMSGRGSAASADDVQKPLFGEFADDRRHLIGRLFVFAENVGQSCVRVCADEARRFCREFGEVRVHLLRAERAVETDREKLFGVKHGDEEGFRALSGEHSSAGVAERRREHDGDSGVAGPHGVADCVDRRFCVEGVEDRFDEEDVGSSVDQRFRLNLIGCGEFVEGDVSRGGVVDGGGHGGCPSGRSHASRDETGLFRCARGHGVGCFARDFGSGERKVVDAVFETVIRLRDGVRVEGVCLNDVRAGFEICVVNGLDGVGTGDAEHIVVAHERFRMVCKWSGVEIGFLQSLRLKHGSHGSVEHKNAFLKLRLQKLNFF